MFDESECFEVKMLRFHQMGTLICSRGVDFERAFRFQKDRKLLGELQQTSTMNLQGLFNVIMSVFCLIVSTRTVEGYGRYLREHRFQYLRILATASDAPSDVPSIAPSDVPSEGTSDVPSAVPSAVPSDIPSETPSTFPSDIPTSVPSDVPSAVPSDIIVRLQAQPLVTTEVTFPVKFPAHRDTLC
jgi:hypothetical protein